MWQALEARLKTINGLTSILLGEPTTIQEAPCLIGVYSSLDVVLKSEAPARNINGNTHVFALRLAIKWQDNPQAEMQLLTLVDVIPAVVDAHLGQALPKGMARCSNGISGFAEYGKEKFRVVDYTVSVFEKQEAT